MKIIAYTLAFIILVSCSPEGDMETSPSQAGKNLNPPTITSVSPNNGSTNVSENSSIVIVFSESMNTNSISVNTKNSTCSDALQISSDNFSSCKKWNANPTHSSNKTMFSVTLADNLTSEATFKIKITTDVKDSDDVNLKSEWVQSSGFSVNDWIQPTVLSTTPNDNTSSISVNTTISLTFSEVMDNSTIVINSDNSSCSGSVRLSSDNFSNCVRFSDNRSTSDNTTFVFFPRDNLSENTTYKIKVTTSVKDEASNSMNSENTLSTGFTTN